MKVTKRDIADISLVWIALYFVPYLFNYAVQAVFVIFEVLRLNSFTDLSMAGSPGYSRFYAVFFAVGQFCVMAAFFWFLLFKRNYILNRLFPGSEQNTLELSDDMPVKLADYSFWITIFGLFTSIQSGVKLVSGLLRAIDTSKTIGMNIANIGKYNIPEIIAVILSVLVIWKAGTISKLLNRINEQK